MYSPIVRPSHRTSRLTIFAGVPTNNTLPSPILLATMLSQPMMLPRPIRTFLADLADLHVLADPYALSELDEQRRCVWIKDLT